MNNNMYWLIAIALFNIVACVESLATPQVEDDGHGDLDIRRNASQAVVNPDDNGHGDVHKDPQNKGKVDQNQRPRSHL